MVLCWVHCNIATQHRLATGWDVSLTTCAINTTIAFGVVRGTVIRQISIVTAPEKMKKHMIRRILILFVSLSVSLSGFLSVYLF